MRLTKYPVSSVSIREVRHAQLSLPIATFSNSGTDIATVAASIGFQFLHFSYSARTAARKALY
jgi:hypothetical protein